MQAEYVNQYAACLLEMAGDPDAPAAKRLVRGCFRTVHCRTSRAHREVGDNVDGRKWSVQACCMITGERSVAGDTIETRTAASVRQKVFNRTGLRRPGPHGRSRAHCRSGWCWSRGS